MPIGGPDRSKPNRAGRLGVIAMLVRRRSTAVWIAALGALAMLVGLSWAAAGVDSLYFNDRLEGRSYDPVALSAAGLMGAAAVAAGAALVCYLVRRPVLAGRIVLVSAFAGLPALVPAVVGIGIWARIRSERRA